MPVKSKTEDLEAFITVIDTGSFSSAANLLNQQVAKVSRAVTRLEKTLRPVDLCCTHFAQQYIGSHIIENASDTILA